MTSKPNPLAAVAADEMLIAPAAPLNQNDPSSMEDPAGILCGVTSMPLSLLNMPVEALMEEAPDLREEQASADPPPSPPSPVLHEGAPQIGSEAQQPASTNVRDAGAAPRHNKSRGSVDDEAGRGGAPVLAKTLSRQRSRLPIGHFFTNATPAERIQSYLTKDSQQLERQRPPARSARLSLAAMARHSHAESYGSMDTAPMDMIAKELRRSHRQEALSRAASTFRATRLSEQDTGAPAQPPESPYPSPLGLLSVAAQRSKLQKLASARRRTRGESQVSVNDAAFNTGAERGAAEESLGVLGWRKVRDILKRQGVLSFLKRYKMKSVLYQADAIVASRTPVNERSKSEITAITRFIARAGPLRVLQPWQLRENASTASRVDYVAGQTATREGTPGDGFFIVLQGAFGVYQRQEGDTDVSWLPGLANSYVVPAGVNLRDPLHGSLINVLHPRQMFGERALLDHCPRNATIKALSSSCAALRINGDDYRCASPIPVWRQSHK